MGYDVSSSVIMHREHIARTIRRMSMQIVEDFKGEGTPLFFGINDRGFSLSKIFAAQLSAYNKSEVSTFQIPIYNNQSDEPLPSLSDEAKTHLLKSSYVVVFDDVLFSGSTMVQALRLIMEVHAPRKLRVGVLIDRGHRRFPIQPDFTGLVSPTKFNEHVEVNFESDGTPESIILSGR